ncbi:MAG: hypothetical protein ACI4O4_01365 [Candidatus Ventricola sp.]
MKRIAFIFVQCYHEKNGVLVRPIYGMKEDYSVPKAGRQTGLNEECNGGISDGIGIYQHCVFFS